ncbi:hypothetical protein PoB_000499900 [Plakobranchus ocellatus]|uniref:Uncharacterized protein n=1 Tax=Plakobranchus ocellatus TaxID=259542 RepID=A0AAV3Y6E3_9GAST|nr:hypothetical protein PoB_000499900 [Plakobranchus ocellatus]
MTDHGTPRCLPKFPGMVTKQHENQDSEDKFGKDLYEPYNIDDIGNQDLILTRGRQWHSGWRIGPGDLQGPLCRGFEPRQRYPDLMEG